jgi:hypothetical protein
LPHIDPGTARKVFLRGVDSQQPSSAIGHLDPDFREKLEKSEMRDSLKLVEELATKKQGSIRRHFPPEANAVLGSNLGNGWHVRAWYDISRLAVQNVLVQVISRLLDFMLELKDGVEQIGDGELNKRIQRWLTPLLCFKSRFLATIVGNNNRAGGSQPNPCK